MRRKDDVMEKIKILNEELEIVSISVSGGNLLVIKFPEVTDLSKKDLSEIEVLTAGGVSCATLAGYTTIYKTDSNSVILSNDRSIYTEPEPIVEPEPYVPTEEEIARQAAMQEIASLKKDLDATDYMVIKCSEYQFAGLDSPYDIVELHVTRQMLRDRINTLEVDLI
jgi:hypothetical protein